MQSTEARVAKHYTNSELFALIEAGWKQLRSTSQGAPVDQLAGVDEFHIGGRAATEIVCQKLALAAGHKVLDIGCGLGGAARYMASHHGVTVEGIDLTPDYVEVGNRLTERVGLGGRVHLMLGSALVLPQKEASVDRVTIFHVGMNIEDKRLLFAEIARVLKPGGLMSAYDVMRGNDAALDYPVPWAADESTSFVASPATYAGAIAAAGMKPEAPESMREMALEFFAAMRARMTESGPPALGLHLLMGAEAGVKVANMVANISNGAIAPVLIIARKPLGTDIQI